MDKRICGGAGIIKIVNKNQKTKKKKMAELENATDPRAVKYYNITSI